MALRASAAMKYIIIKDGEQELPVVFAGFFSHDSIAVGRTVVSAGFCSVSSLGWRCWGKSASLGIVSRNTLDEAIMNEWLCE